VPLLTSLLLLIVVARLLGALLVRFKQPALVGEMLAGVILGPAVLNLVQAGPALSGISELAVFLVVLSAGLEMNFEDVIGIFRQGKGLLIALLGFVIPLLAGVLVGVVFGFDVMRTVFLGLCVSITALPVAVRILSSFNLLNTDIAKYSVATAVINDIAALLALGVILDLPTVRSFHAIAMSILFTGGKLILLAALVIGFNRVIGKIEKKGVHLHLLPEKLVSIFGNEALFGIVIAFVLAFGSISEALGFHFVIGAFFGALLIDKKFFLVSRYDELERTLGSITGGFLAPVFFAYLGLEFKITEMHSPSFVASVLVVSVVSKVLAGWIGGRLAKMPPAEALGLGIILNGRGIMELVVAGIAYQRGFIGSGLFSTLVLMGVVTTLLTPILFRRFVLPRLA
jgi:Kef-type K+ transport system membrane component KefB